MFKELYKDLSNLLTESTIHNIKFGKAPTPIENLLKFEYGMKPENIKKCVMNSSDTISHISRVFIVYDFDEIEKELNRIVGPIKEIVPYLGRPTFVYIISYNSLTMDYTDDLLYKLWLVLNNCVGDFQITYSVVTPIIDNTIMYKILEYASFVIVGAIAHYIYKDQFTDSFVEKINESPEFEFSTKMITKDTITSLNKILDSDADEVIIGQLLDNGYLLVLGHMEDEYPNLLFMESEK